MMGSRNIADVATEAAYRIGFVLEMIDCIRERPAGETNPYSGYDFEIVEEILKDVAKGLQKAAGNE